MAKTEFKNKLSRAYRFKKKIGHVKKRNEVVHSDEKKSRIVIRNLSFQTTEEDLRRLYQPFGRIEEINLLKRPDGKLVGCGFIQFNAVQDASKAIFKTNKTEFLGRTISCEWAISKSRFVEKLKKEDVKEEEVQEVKDDKEQSTEEQSEQKSPNKDKISEKKEIKNVKKNQKLKAKQRKIQKLKKREKKSRIVIRNLPFTITEDALKERFSKYGNIKDVNILKKPDGKPKGVCFLQFDKVNCAAQAIHHENMKSILDRPMIVDWALPKDKFQKSNDLPEVKKEEEEDDEIEVVKEEKNKNFDPDKIQIKEEKESDEEKEDTKEDSGNENSNEDNKEESNENSDEDDDTNDNVDDVDDVYDDDDNDNNEDDKDNIKLECDKSVASSMASSNPRRVSNDVSEGKTIFIKNVPFSATNEDLKQCMLQFGPVYYALVCVDKLTEHSKGTAFVKFVDVENAEKCLAAGTELKLHEQVLDPHKALHRQDVTRMNDEKKQKSKDSRNLYLIKEGVIYASSPAAQDVSASDMTQRLTMEKWKSQMLRNLNMFVSRVRLAIHNLPESCDDEKLLQLIKKHSNPGVVITEARVMRDLKNLDAKGIGKTKGYGFVTFTKHEDALRALRSINNNPNVFTKTKRPIVAFSIENRSMVNAKQKRLERSRQQNPTWKGYKRPAEDDDDKTSASKINDKKSNKRLKKNKTTNEVTKQDDNDVKTFTGSTGKPGNKRPIGKFFLKKQAATHQDNVKLQKKQKKLARKMTAKKIERAASRMEAKPKQGHKKPDADEVNFSKIVNKHKNKQKSAPSAKSKWYEKT